MNEILKRMMRFVISGGIALSFNLGVFHFLILSGVWYLGASIVGFLAGFFVSFTLQKFWTFADRSVDRIGSQAATYFAIVLFNLGLNTTLVFLFVEYGGVVPIGAQLLAAAIVACESFFAYRRLVFSPRRDDAARGDIQGRSRDEL